MSTSETTKVDRQPSAADDIVESITSCNATSDPGDDLDADDQWWIETVIASLEGRSQAARKALAKALINGDKTVTSASHVSGLELDKSESEGNTSLPRTPPVSGTSLQKTAVFQALVTPSRAKCRTEVSHTAQATSDLTLGNRWARHDLHCRTEDERCFAPLLLIASSETGRGRDIEPSQFR